MATISVYFPSEINVAKIESGEIYRGNRSSVLPWSELKTTSIRLRYLEQPIHIEVPSLRIEKFDSNYQCSRMLVGLNSEMRDFLFALDERILDLAVENIATWGFQRVPWGKRINLSPKTDEEREKVRTELKKTYKSMVRSIDRRGKDSIPAMCMVMTKKKGLVEEDYAHLDYYSTEVYDKELTRITGGSVKDVFAVGTVGVPVVSGPTLRFSDVIWGANFELLQFRIDTPPPVKKTGPMFRTLPVGPTAPPRPKDEDPTGGC